MTMMLEALFVLAAVTLVYTFVGYPLLLLIWSRRCSAGFNTTEASPLPSFSLILAAHNEATNLARRLDELTAAILGQSAEIIVVSDGSTDDTASIARGYLPLGVHVLELPAKSGKAAALSHAAQQARYEMLVFADARQRWSMGAIAAMLRRFADRDVGAVGGELVLTDQNGIQQGVGLYWRFEKWLRRREAQIHSTIGVSGAIAAVRRDLFFGIPSGLVLDDVYWPMRIAMSGYRVAFEPQAKAFDALPANSADEFRRKTRTQAGMFQLLARLPSVLSPRKNPVWFQFWSHKVLRLAAPWAMLVTLASSAMLDGFLYRAALWAELAVLCAASIGFVSGCGRRFRLVAAASAFVLLNAAAWWGFWVWLAGGASGSWQKADYACPSDGMRAAADARV
jgi:cellulose synthase/poly-beta-1,6-N-acetylglucosamine synthase-like glycosyltransferase